MMFVDLLTIPYFCRCWAQKWCFSVNLRHSHSFCTSQYQCGFPSASRADKLTEAFHVSTSFRRYYQALFKASKASNNAIMEALSGASSVVTSASAQRWHQEAPRFLAVNEWSLKIHPADNRGPVHPCRHCRKYWKGSKLESLGLFFLP